MAFLKKEKNYVKITVDFSNLSQDDNKYIFTMTGASLPLQGGQDKNLSYISPRLHVVSPFIFKFTPSFSSTEWAKLYSNIIIILADVV